MTRETSGKSIPSLKRLIPTNTSYSPSLRLRSISTLSTVSISECRYATLIPKSCKYEVRSSAILLVKVVIRTLSPFSVFFLTSDITSSI